MMSGFGGHIWMIIIWIAIIGGGVWLLATLFPRANTSMDTGVDMNGDALAILEKRYARGEISKEESETIRRDLEQA